MLPAPLHPPLSGFHITKQQERKAKTKQVSVTSNIHAAKCTEYLSDLFVSKYHLTQWTVSSISEHSLLGFYRIPHSVVFQLLLCFFHCFARSSRLGNGKVWWFLQGLVLCLLFLGLSEAALSSATVRVPRTLQWASRQTSPSAPTVGCSPRCWGLAAPFSGHFLSKPVLSCICQLEPVWYSAVCLQCLAKCLARGHGSWFVQLWTGIRGRAWGQKARHHCTYWGCGWVTLPWQMSQDSWLREQLFRW